MKYESVVKSIDMLHSARQYDTQFQNYLTTGKDSVFKQYFARFDIRMRFEGYPLLQEPPGPHLNTKTVLSTYGDFHVKDKTAVRTSYL